MFMNVICSISDVVGKVNKKMWYSIVTIQQGSLL